MTPNETVRPVSWLAVASIFFCLGLFLLVARSTYLRHPWPAPHTIPAEQLPAENAWQATPQARREYLATLLQGQREQATTYGWVDRAKGVVRLPIDRAMELTVRELNARPKK